jgi:curved DNA-binding protein CbpA
LAPFHYLFEKDNSLGRHHLKVPNYYELLQINPNAEPDTVHRVYRFLAARFHPDNPDTGDADKFAMLKQAYDVLSNPVSRAEYDLASTREAGSAAPLSSSVDFMDSMEGEMNRRLAVLALLYFRRRSDSSHPQVSLYEVEARMGFPREYLEFTIWYLQKKQYIVRADNADFTLTAEGVDFIETQRGNIPVLNRLLTNGDTPLATAPAPAPIIVPPSSGVSEGASVQ